jgi:hypothetical protein
MTQEDRGYALVVPLGPAASEHRRFHDLVDSLITYERGPRLCVTVDSAPRPRNIAPRNGLAGSCRFHTLRAPYRGQGEPLLGQLSAGILLALRTVDQAGSFEFVLRMDTDALVIGPFRDAVLALLAAHPDAGMLGTLGCTCRREAWYYGCENTATSDVVSALDASQAADRGVERIRSHLRLAIENGYTGKEYCQGGVCVLSSSMISRLSAMGSLDHPEDWLPLAVPEDVMLGMYARTVALRSIDASLPGQPFANHWGGLPYTPAELVKRGSCLIHSVKGDPRYSEAEIRSYFRALRLSYRDAHHRSLQECREILQ